MSNVWCVRAGFGTYTKHFVEGGYMGIGYDSLRGSEIAAGEPAATHSDPIDRAWCRRPSSTTSCE